ncbi:MAG: diaminopimelate epimerase [Oscillospiraceae bacterium]
MKFWKMNGAGNDFLILNNMEEHLPHAAFPALAARLCERHLSIGADGLMVVEKPEAEGDIRMLFYNADGSVGEMCGNGARCICRYAYENGLAGEVQRIETMSGTVIGYRLDSGNYRIRLNPPTVLELDYPVEAGGKLYECSYVELGTPGLPHAVVPLKDLDHIPDGELAALGRKLRHSPAFSRGANINFYELRPDGSVGIKTYERGVEDLTYACGTGTGSTALVLRKKGLVPEGEVTAFTRGGVLRVRVEEREGETALWLTGPTNIVARGEVTDEELESNQQKIGR